MADSGPNPATIDKLEWAVWPSFAMLAGIQLDVFTIIKDSPMKVEQIAGLIGVRSDKLKPLLYTLAAVGLLTVEGGVFSNTREANHFLVKGSPSYRGAKYELISGNWQAGLKTAESIRAGTAQANRDFASASEETLEMFYRSNHHQALRRGRELAAMYDLSPHRTLLDVGGGSGGLAIAISEAYPHIEATVIDLPLVTPITKRVVEEAGAGHRVHVLTADLLSDQLPGSFDAAVLSSIIQVMSPDTARRLLHNVGKVIGPGGIIYIRGDVLDDSGVSPLESVLRNLIYLNVYNEGQAYTEQEHKAWLKESGFDDVERRILPDGFSLITARKQPRGV